MGATAALTEMGWNMRSRPNCEATTRERSAMPAIPKIPPRRKREPLTRSQIMARIRSGDTRPEIMTRAAVHALGLRFRNHVVDLPGKPDLANKTHKWAIFVHGCFWHSHRGCRLASSPKSNTAYWIEKLNRNRLRDTEKSAALRSLGFRVLTIWECEVQSKVRLAEAIARFFSEAPGANRRR